MDKPSSGKSSLILAAQITARPAGLDDSEHCCHTTKMDLEDAPWLAGEQEGCQSWHLPFRAPWIERAARLIYALNKRSSRCRGSEALRVAPLFLHSRAAFEDES